jgi:hypothetical protein
VLACAARDVRLRNAHRDTLYSSRVLRDILFEDENKVPLNEFVEVSQKYEKQNVIHRTL